MLPGSIIFLKLTGKSLINDRTLWTFPEIIKDVKAGDEKPYILFHRFV